ncbi:response regulator [Achromobacter seleniivolatilans]|uniref:Response regulator n=1 Tax=Achromobacter seleniivolatilans TaxID=3047478 RepID=A0ABY9MAJ5_9BURK|nr:response regulator [Achromobacter sp. R39]WMD23682.1 response regulator [Achromobacter sp. R39]
MVHIVDDDAAMRDALAWLFQTRNVHAYQWDSGEAFLSAWEPAMPGCILLDIRMPGMSGLEVFDALLERHASQAVVFLSGHGDLASAVEALKRGAADFIEKPFNDNDVVDRVLAAGVAAAKKRQAAQLAEQRETLLKTLSVRERDVLRCVLQGMLNKQIADMLGVSMRMVEVHRARVLEKMGLRNVVELARLFGHDFQNS